ncbi:MAG TPA: hypothetical protein PKA54_07545 [Chitinophagaceae bacterium]|nr:MAG: hypothetical protein UZ11_BCD004001376 [Bacteroidetes bacterium OLB11]HMN33211.1 hypothetical protein [Chitinophagaceae bacterium]
MNSAKHYWGLSEILILAQDSYVFIANFYNRNEYVSIKEQINSIWQVIKKWLQVHENHDAAPDSINKNE